MWQQGRLGRRRWWCCGTSSPPVSDTRPHPLALTSTQYDEDQTKLSRSSKRWQQPSGHAGLQGQWLPRSLAPPEEGRHSTGERHSSQYSTSHSNSSAINPCCGGHLGSSFQDRALCGVLVGAAASVLSPGWLGTASLRSLLPSVVLNFKINTDSLSELLSRRSCAQSSGARAVWNFHLRACGRLRCLVVVPVGRAT